jgi:hypothetical protein
MRELLEGSCSDTVGLKVASNGVKGRAKQSKYARRDEAMKLWCMWWLELASFVDAFAGPCVKFHICSRGGVVIRL